MSSNELFSLLFPIDKNELQTTLKNSFPEINWNLTDNLSIKKDSQEFTYNSIDKKKKETITVDFSVRQNNVEHKVSVTTKISDNGLGNQAFKTEDFSQEKYQNALTKSAISLANEENSEIVYAIGWKGVLHKFSFFTHFLRVLQENPNKQILVLNLAFLSQEQWDQFESKFPKSKYPNVTFSKKSVLYSEEALLETTGLGNYVNKTRKQHLFVDDFLFRQKLSFFSQSRDAETSAKFLKDLSILNSFTTVNIISDGSGSVADYSNETYNMFLNNNILMSRDDITKRTKYQKLDLIRTVKDFSLLNSAEQKKIYVLSLMNSSDWNQDGIQDTQFFNPSMDFIADGNSSSKSEKGKLDTKSYNDDFLLFHNEREIDLIQTIESLNSTMFESLIELLGSSSQKITGELSQLDGGYNLVYSGQHLGETQLGNVESEARKILQIYERALIENNTSLPIRIFFKGHPRDTTNAIDVLAPKIDSLNSNTNIPSARNWLRTLDAKIPFELYTFYSVFRENNSTRSTKVVSGFSTLVSLLHANNQQNIVSQIMMDKKTYNTAFFDLFGHDSKIYQKNKIILVD